MILFLHRLKEGETSRALLERALLSYCDAIGKRKPRKKNRAVAEGEHGKPYYPALPSVFCSVSHSRGYWAALFDRHPCGVDIEGTTRSRASRAIIRRKFTPEEQALFGEESEDASGSAAPGPSADEETFLRVWTRKEAYLKYTGEGLSRDLLSFSVAGRDADGRPAFREDAEPFYGEPRVVLGEIGFGSVTDPDGGPVPLIGAFCGTPGTLTILPLPEASPEETLEEAKEYALGWLEARERTEREIRDKLREKGVLPETIDETVAFLAEYRLIDDEAYAARFAESAVRKGHGPLRIERDLARRGIGRETAERALSSYRRSAGRIAGDPAEAFHPSDSDSVPDAPNTAISPDDAPTFRETAGALARTVYAASGSPPELDDKLASKILRRLASRGFSASDSYAALDALRRMIREERDA